MYALEASVIESLDGFSMKEGAFRMGEAALWSCIVVSFFSEYQ